MIRFSVMAALLSSTAFVYGALALPEAPCRDPADVSQYSVLPLGVINVVEQYRADPTGKSDSTAAFQWAFTESRTQNVTLFVPLGCYVISDTLLATQPRNGRWQPTQIIGEVPSEEDSRRPTFVLKPHTPAFASPSKFRPMMAFWTNWCVSYGPDPDLRFDDDDFCKPGVDKSMPPYLFNMVLQGVDFLIGEGNPGAVGVYMVGAQGSTIQDVSVFAAPDALAGVAGGNGGGGVFVGVSVTGGRYGLDARSSAGWATYAAMEFVNQTCAGIVVGPNLRSTTAIVGLKVQGSPSLGGVIAAKKLPQGFSPCAVPKPGGADTPYLGDPWAHNKKFRSSPKGNHELQLRDAMSIVDASFELSMDAPCVSTDASMWIQNMYTSGCTDIVVSGGKTVARSQAGSHAHVKEFALGRQNWDGMLDSKIRYSFPVVVNGQRSVEAMLEMDQEPAPEGLVSRHHWGSSGVDWQSKGAVNVLELGAVGDGVTDDWTVLQTAVDNYDIVVLPRGLYRLSKPLKLHRRGSALIGVGNTKSVLMPVSGGFQPQAQPVLDMVADDATVKSISIVTWNHLASTYTMRWSGNGVWRQTYPTRESESEFPLFKAFGQTDDVPDYSSPENYDRPLVVISGGGAFYDFDVDFGCCFGDVYSGPYLTNHKPEIASTHEVLLQRPGFRTLLVNDSHSGLRFYPHNTEQAFSDAYTEIAYSSNVTLYNAKTENNYAALWIRDSDLITVHGWGGNACPFPNTTRYNDGSDIRHMGVTGYADFMPSSIRVQRSTRVSIANIVNMERLDNPSSLLAAGRGFDPRLYNMILHQDVDGFCEPSANSDCAVSAVLDRPVLWRWDGKAPDVQPEEFQSIYF